MHGTSLNLGRKTETSFVSREEKAPLADDAKDLLQQSGEQTNTPNSTSLQTGLSLSGSATYWLDPTFGFGLDYTFAHTSASLEAFHSLGLEPKNLVEAPIVPAEGGKRETKSKGTEFSFPSPTGGSVTVTTNNAPVVFGDDQYQVTRTTLSGGTLFTTRNAADVGALTGNNTFINSEKAVPTAAAANAPTNKFTADGRIAGSREASTTMHMADALTKTVLGATNRGELHLLAGLSLPMIMTRTLTTSVITGEDGTGAATQKVEYVDPADADNKYTQVISVEAKSEQENTRTETMVGPMIGLGGTFQLNDSVRLYGKFGYTPFMMGNSSTSLTLTEKAKVVTSYRDVGANAAGVRAGSTTEERDETSSTGATHSIAGGNASSFVLGARFELTETLGLNVEGVSQNVSGYGYTGLNAGVSLGF